MRHTRKFVIPGDLVVCSCCATGRVVKKGWWIFSRYVIEWFSEPSEKRYEERRKLDS